ncbi:hypothetical protein ACOMHN_019496 [Nucella lapillus]
MSSAILFFFNENTGISPLKDLGKLVTDDKEKAEILNRQFQSAFSTREDFSEEEFKLRCPMPPRDPQQPPQGDITITTAGVEKLLKNLDPSKAGGPDELSPRVLKERRGTLWAGVGVCDDHLVVGNARTTYRQMSFFPRTIPEWNLLPAEIATAPSLASFQARVTHLK